VKGQLHAREDPPPPNSLKEWDPELAWTLLRGEKFLVPAGKGTMISQKTSISELKNNNFQNILSIHICTMKVAIC
jgi:hypothetical protein